MASSVSRPQDREPLTAETITACGVALADAGGLEMVSMRRIAETLGVSAMALYRHVESREALLLAMAANAGRGSALLPPGPAPWQEMLRHLAAEQWDGFARHPWLLQIVLGPGRLLDMAPTDGLDLLLHSLHDAGLAEEECFDCVLGLSATVMGAAILALAANPGPGRHRPTRPNAVVPLNAEDGAAPDTLAAGFRGRGVTYDAALRSLDFSVAAFLRGVEARISENVRTQHQTSA